MKTAYNPFTRKLDMTDFTASDAAAVLRYVQLQETTEDMDIYVSTTGSDTNGDGSEAKPYATPTKAYQDVPRRVAHNVRIRIESGTYNDWPAVIDNEYVGPGCLSIFGVGTPEVVYDNLAVTAIANTTALMAQKVTIGAASFTPGALCGNWLKITSGLHAGRAHLIYDNDATNIYIQYNTDQVHNLDTVQIVRPSTKIVANEWTFVYKPRSQTTNAAYGFSRFVLSNLWLDFSAAANPHDFGQLCMHSEGSLWDNPMFDFVRFDTISMGTTYIDFSSNQFTVLDDTYVADCGAGITSMNTGSTSPGYTHQNSTGRSGIGIYVYGGSLYDCAIDGIVCFSGYNPSGALNSGVGAIQSYIPSGYGQCFISGVDGSTPAIDAWGDFQFKVDVIGPCSYAVDGANATAGSSFVAHSGNSCSATLTTYSAVRIPEAGILRIKDACASFKGATSGQKAYIFAANTAVKSDNWPNANTLTEDTRGGKLLRTT